MLQKLTDFISRVFSIIGALAIIIIAIEVVAIFVLAPRWDVVDQLQENLAKKISAKISPSHSRIDGIQNNDIGIKITNNQPFKTSNFSISLSPATRTLEEINVKASIKNITSQPLFIAFNKRQSPILTDDNFSFTSKYRRSEGIAWGYIENRGREKEERSYTQILPGERLDIGMEFRAYPRGTPEVNSNAHVTFDFITLFMGEVESVSATPGTTLRFQ
ncbi:hypothetical protein DSCO28_01940 [Desulfosarcina ovata subsp. sediminis]|uniref:Uncharacterized protein n=1 Tax=Desulfosarcina ovata subsp. sediminis TaxID=885957 RepID=A0A5K7ZBU1_9BACT|nr:hypothetical protein DSCO28_01940 [Desulfosarcina ovata subsp. sediminis]